MFDGFLEAFDPMFLSGMEEYVKELIMAYVPDAEYMGYTDAIEQALVKDELAAEQLLYSLEEGGVI